MGACRRGLAQSSYVGPKDGEGTQLFCSRPMSSQDGDITKLKDDAWDQWMVQRRGEQTGKDNASAGGATAAYGGGSGAARPSLGSQQQPWQGKAFSGPGGSRDRSGDKCFHCNGSGHWASNCPTKKAAGGGTGGGGGGAWAQRTYQQRG